MKKDNITQEDLKHLKLVRNYFGEHDKTLFEHRAYAILDSLLRKLQTRKLPVSKGCLDKDRGKDEPCKYPIGTCDYCKYGL